MVMGDVRGVVLQRHFPRACLISLLDREYGHIKVIPRGWRWASYAVPGSLIHYEIEERNGAFFIDALELVYAPIEAQGALVFLHHLLELCALTLPVQCGSHESFELMCEVIMTLETMTCSPVGQQVAIAKLLFAGGLYPPDVQRLSVVHELERDYADLKTVRWYETQQRELAIFIYQCLQQHPARALLKTINFLPWGKP